MKTKKSTKLNRRKESRPLTIALALLVVSSSIVILGSKEAAATSSGEANGIKIQGVPKPNDTETDWDIYYCWQNASANYSYAGGTSEHRGPGNNVSVIMAFFPNSHSKRDELGWGTNLDFGLNVRVDANPGWRYDYFGDGKYTIYDPPLQIKHVKINIAVDPDSQEEGDTWGQIYYGGSGERKGYYKYKELESSERLPECQFPFHEIGENHNDDTQVWWDDINKTTETTEQNREIRKWLDFTGVVLGFIPYVGTVGGVTIYLLNNCVFQDVESNQDLHQSGCGGDYSMEVNWDYPENYYIGETCTVAGNYYLKGELNVGTNEKRQPHTWKITATATFHDYNPFEICKWEVKTSMLVTLVPRYWRESGGDYEPNVRAGVVEPIHKDVADFSADASDDDIDTILYYNWDFGDGENSRNWSTCPTISHDYAPNSGGGSGSTHTRSPSTSMVWGGPYNITLKVCDGSHVVTTWTWIDNYPPPVLAPNTNPSGWTSNRQPTIYWNAVTDNCSGLLRYEYQIDSTDGEWIPNGLKTSFVTPELSEGIHNIYVRALDRNKNKGSWGIAIAKIDLTAPSPPESVTEGDPDNDQYLTTTGKYYVYWTEAVDLQSDVLYYELQEKHDEESSWATLSSTLSNSTDSYYRDHSGEENDGVTYSYRVRAENNVGDWSGFKASNGIHISLSGPICSVHAIVENYGNPYLYEDGIILYYNPDFESGFTIRVKASATGGLWKAEGSLAFGDSPIDTTPEAGEYQFELPYSIEIYSTWQGTIEVTVYDYQSRTFTCSIYVVRDNTPPTINSAWINESEVLLHADESKFYCNGVIGPPNNIVTFSLQGTSYDIDSGLYRATFSPAFGKNPLDDYAPSSWCGKYEDGEIPNTDGDITVTLYDNVNNTVTWVVNYVTDCVDPQPPVITEHHCGTNWTNHNTPYITWDIPQDDLKEGGDGIGSGVDFYYIYDYDTKLYHYHEWGTSIHLDLSDGIHNISIRPIDGVDNQGDKSNIVTVKIDTVEPYGTIIINNNYIGTTSPFVNLTLTASDDRSGVYRVRFRNWENDGWYRNWGAWEDFNSSKSWTLNNSQGYKKVFYQIMDNAGNIYECNDTIILDWTPPSAPAILYESSSNSDHSSTNWGKSNDTIFWSASEENVGVECYDIQERVFRGGTLLRNWTTLSDSIHVTHYTVSDRIHNDTYQYWVRAKDKSGLLGSFSKIFSVKIDIVKPFNLNVHIEDSYDDQWGYVIHGRAANLTLSAEDNLSGLYKMRFRDTMPDGYVEHEWRDVFTYIDSPHPYPTPYDNEWKIEHIGADKIKIHFEYIDSCFTSIHGDYGVILYDKLHEKVCEYGWYETNVWTDEIPGDTAYIRLYDPDSDNMSKNGFRIDQYAYYSSYYVWSEENHTIDSPHPYQDDYDNTWVIEEQDATNMLVHFSWIDTEPYRLVGDDPRGGEGGGGTDEEPPDEPYWKGDRILIYDEGGYPDNPLEEYSGNYSDFRTCRVSGDKVYIRLVSDSIVTCEGFHIDRYQYTYTDDNSESMWSSWELYSPSKYWIFPPGQCSKYIYFQAMDFAGNIAGPVHDNTYSVESLDTENPSAGWVSIDNGKNFTNSSFVELNYSASDPSPSSGMLVRFSHDNATWTVWEYYSPPKSWILADGNDGNRSVYMEVRDEEGYIGGGVSDTIVLDNNPPNITLSNPVNDSWINNTRPAFNWTAADPLLGLGLSGTYRIQISNNSDFTDLVIDDNITGSTNNGAANTYIPSEGFSEGAYYWRVNGQDNADNWGVSVQRIIKIDTSSSPPVDNATTTLSNDTTDIKVSWKGPLESAEIDYYNTYRRSREDENFILVAAIPNNKTYWTDVGAGNNYNKYSYMVKTVDRAGNLGEGLVPPTLVKLFNPTSITSNSMELNWTQNNDTDFQRYELHKSTTPNFTLDFTSNSTTLYESSITRSWTKETVSGLSPSTKYYFKVAVFNTDELCAISNEVNNTTGQFDLELVAGLNLISMPLDINDPDDTDPFDAQELIDLINADGGGAVSVSRWLAATGVWDTFNDGGASPFEIKVWEGYFVNCNRASTWNIAGKEQGSAPVDIVAGLTLIGTSMDMGTGYNAQDLIDDINADGGDVQAVSRWLAATGVWDTFNDGGASPFIIERGVGYFINNAVASTWTPG